MATEKELNAVQGWRFMVEILCPHCDEEIELEDGISGEFACPYCDGEFEWNLAPETSKKQSSSPSSIELSVNPLVIGREVLQILVLALVVIGLTGPTLYSVSSVYDDAEFTAQDVNGNDYEDEIEMAKESKEFCLALGSIECGVFDEMVDAFGLWNLAGGVYSLFMFLALATVIVSISCRALSGLTMAGKLTMPTSWFRKSHSAGKFGILVACIFWIIAMLSFIIISPSVESTFGLTESEAEEAISSSGYSALVWFSILLSIVMPVLTVMFFLNTTVEFEEPSGQPMDFTSMASASFSTLGGLFMIGSFFFGWIAIGDFASLRPTGLHISFYDFEVSTGWFELVGTEGAGLLGALGILFFLLTLIALIAQLAHTAFVLSVQLDDLNVIDMSAERYNFAYYLQTTTAFVSLGFVIGAYVLIQLGSLIALGSDSVTGSIDEIPRPSGLLLLFIGILVAQALAIWSNLGQKR